MTEPILPKSTLAVQDTGEALKHTSRWPMCALDIEALRDKLLKKMLKLEEADMQDIHKRCEALSDALASMRSSEQEVLASTAMIPLPFPVSCKLEKVELLGSRDGARLICAVLKAEESTHHAMATPKVDFLEDDLDGGLMVHD